MRIALDTITDGKDSLKHGIETVLGKQIELRVKDYHTVIGFVFKQVSAIMFNRMLRERLDCDTQQLTEVRDWINGSGYVMQHLKPYLFKCFKSNINSKSACIEQAKAYKVKKLDYRLVRLIFRKKMQKLLSPLRKYKALSFAKYQERMAELPVTLNKYARKFCNKKMRFIFQNQHYGVDLEDIVNHVQMKGMQNVYMTYPKIETPLHALNIAKGAISKHGINFIHYMTCAVRGIVKRSPDGTFYSSIVPITENSAAVVEAAETDAFGFNANAEMARQSESNITCSSLLKRFAGKKQKALQVMLGYNHQDFTEWLHKNKLTKLTNAQVYEDMLTTRYGSKQYLKWIADWLDVKVVKVVQLGEQVGSFLRGDNVELAQT